MKKRILSTLLSAAMLLSLFTMTALADDESESGSVGSGDVPVVTVDSGTVNVGENIELAVKMTNVQPFTNFEFSIAYDKDVFEFVGYSDSSYTAEVPGFGTVTSSYLSTELYYSNETTICTTGSASAIKVNGYGGDGTMFKFTLRAKEDAVNGDYVVALGPSTTKTGPYVAYDGVEVNVAYYAGTVTITGGVETHNVTFNTDEHATVSLAAEETATLTDGVATVNEGDDLRFTVAADEDYTVDSVMAGETKLEADAEGIYTLPAVGADTTVTITTKEVEKASYTVTFTGDNATVSVDGAETTSTTVTEGGSVSFTVAADEGYQVTSVMAGDTELTADETDVYTLPAVTGDTTVTVTAKRVYTVTFTGDNATVTVGDKTVTSTPVIEGESVNFTVTPVYGYAVTEVTAGGTALTGENGVYTLPGVGMDTDVAITTEDVSQTTYTVTFTGENATVKVDDEAVESATVNWDGSVSFTVTPADGDKVSSVTANGTALTAVRGVYTLSNVTEDVAVTVTTKAVGSTTWDGTVDSSFRSGSGTEDDPYIIASADELAYLAKQVNATKPASNPLADAYFKLDADLDLDGKTWTPIGKSLYYFTGTFDGGGHTISGLSISTTSNYQGLFGYVKDGTIQNLVVSGAVKGGQYTGGLIGYASSVTLINCGNEVDVTGTKQVGGLIGHVSTLVTLINCSNEANVTGTQQVGGLIGYGTGTTKGSCVLTGCYNTGTITMTGSGNFGLGGLAGSLQMGTVLTNCYNAGATAKAGAAYEGGLVGRMDNASGYPTTIENCFNVGTFSEGNNSSRGGLIGSIAASNSRTTTNSYYLISACDLDTAGGSSPITEAEFSTLAATLGDAFTATTAGTVTFTGDNVQVKVDGAAVESVTAYSYPALTWEGVTTRDSGGAASFKVAADDGYEVESVTTADGTVLTADADGVYTLTGVTGDTTVSITTKAAEKASYEVTFTGDNATVALTDETLTLTDNKVTVTDGTNLSFTVTVEENYEVISVTVGEKPLTADENGVYTLENVAAATEVTITAQEKSVPAADYTVSLKPGAAEVEAGKTVTVDVVVTPGEGKEFAAWDIVLTYDTALFTYQSASGTATTNGTVKDTDGSIQLLATSDANFTAETTIATLTFTAKEGTEGQPGSFGLTADIAASVASLTENAVTAATTGTTVAIKASTTYTITFYAEDGATISTINVPMEGENAGKIDSTVIPVAPDVDYMTFAGWKLNDTTSYTAAELVNLTVTGNMSLTATYTAKEYTVSHTGITGADTATYFDAYEGTIQNYSSSYTYTVTVTATDGSTTLYTVKSADIDSTGKFTIPEGVITGNVTLTVSKSLGDVAIAVYENYVAGQGDDGIAYSLIVVYGTAAGYEYDGNAMYRVAAYDGDRLNTITGGKAYAYMVSGTPTTDEVERDLEVADATDGAHTINDDNDVNGTGTTDIADAQAVRDCYNAKNADSARLMATYLRADRDGDHEVDSDDITIVMDKLTR